MKARVPVTQVYNVGGSLLLLAEGHEIEVTAEEAKEIEATPPPTGKAVALKDFTGQPVTYPTPEKNPATKSLGAPKKTKGKDNGSKTGDSTVRKPARRR